MSLEIGSDNMCVDCEVRLLKLKRNGSVIVVSLEKGSESMCVDCEGRLLYLKCVCECCESKESF